MENVSCHPSFLLPLVCAPLASRCPSYVQNPIVLSSLKIWKQSRQHLKLSAPIPLSPICNNHLFPPSVTDTVFTLWKEKGLFNFSDLYLEGIFATFNDLCIKYNLPQSLMFSIFPDMELCSDTLCVFSPSSDEISYSRGSLPSNGSQ